MKKKLFVSIFTLMSLLGGYGVSQPSSLQESATDGFIANETSVHLKGRKFASVDSESKKNEATLLASKMGVQAGVNQKGQQCMRFVVAVPHLNVNVSFHRTLTKEDGTISTKDLVATTAYTSIQVNDQAMKLDASANDVFNTVLADGTSTAYQYFVCYTMAGFTEDLATLGVQAEITDLSEENNLGSTTQYNIANIAGVEGTVDPNDATSESVTINGVVYTLSEDKTYYTACTVAAFDAEAPYQEEYEIVPYIIHGQGLVASSSVPVTKIAARCFSNSWLGSYGGAKYNTVTKKIILPPTITEIGDYSFVGMENLQSVNLPDSIETIGVGAFNGCIGLQGTLELPLNLKKIGVGAFANCKQVEKIVLPEGITTIENHAFLSCYALKDINLPHSLTSLGGRMFYGCKNLKNVQLPKNDTFTTLSEDFFRDCPVENVVIPNTITMIGHNAFRAPDATDGDYAGGIYSALKSVTFEPGSKLTTIQGNVFRSQTQLASIQFPETLQSIGNIFGGCTGLTTFNISRDLTTFGDKTYNPIRLCTSLKEITIHPENQNFKVEGDGLYSKDGTVLWGHMHGSESAEFVIPHSVKEIVGQVFWGSRNVKTLKYEGTVEEWGKMILGEKWNNDCGFTAVECLDGTVTL